MSPLAFTLPVTVTSLPMNDIDDGAPAARGTPPSSPFDPHAMIRDSDSFSLCAPD
jgi:hypothetical protein